MLFPRDQFARASGEHLGDRVADYVDGMLNADEEYRADIHLTVCEHCRFAVKQERTIIEQLRSVSFDRGGHEQLMAGLLSLAASEPGAPVGAGLPGAGSRGRATSASRPAPAVVTSSAPPQYQSARKSMACALFAVAGCVGVALVATTASGSGTGPEGNGSQVPGRAALVRNVSSTRATGDVTARREAGGGAAVRNVPMFVQVVSHPTP